MFHFSPGVCIVSRPQIRRLIDVVPVLFSLHLLSAPRALPVDFRGGRHGFRQNLLLGFKKRLPRGISLPDRFWINVGSRAIVKV